MSLVIALAVALVATAPAQAAPQWLSPVTVNAASQYADSPIAAINSSGTTVYLYRTTDSSNVEQMWAVVRPPGGSFGAPQDLTSAVSPAGANGYASLSVGRDGSFIAAWQLSLGSGQTDLQTATLAAGSTSFGPTDTLETTPANSGAYSNPPVAATDAKGDSVVAWPVVDGASGNVIVEAFLRPAGGNWSSATQISDNSATHVYNAVQPQVAIDDAGDITVAWLHAVAGGLWGLDTIFRPASPSFTSATWGSVNNVVASGVAQLGVQNFPDLVDNGSGKIALGYVINDGPNGEYRAHVIVASSGAGPFTDDQAVSAAGESTQLVPVAVDPAGDVLAAWITNSSPTRLEATERTAGSNVFESPKTLSTTASGDLIELGLDDHGNAFAAWQGQDAACTQSCVQAATRPSGGSWSPYQDISENGSYPASGSGGGAVPLTTDATGDAVVGWDAGNPTSLGVTPYSNGPSLTNLQIPSNGTMGTPISFSVTASDPWASISSITWTFGDGASGHGTDVSHSYTKSGNYQVSVTATDGEGNTATAPGQIAIAGGGGSGGGGGNAGGGGATSKAAPAVVTAAPTIKSTTSADFSVTVNPEGLATTVEFEYGPSLAAARDVEFGPSLVSQVTYTATTPGQPVAADFSEHTITVAVSGLLPNTTYHYRAIATNAGGSTTGPDQTLSTPSDPPPPPPVLGKSVDVKPAGGLVLVKTTHGFVPLTEATALLPGAVIDARLGTLQLTAAEAHHQAETGSFGGAVFQLAQDHQGLVTLSLLEGSFAGAPTYASCKLKAADASSPTASAAALSTKVLQTLHASAHGRFRTRGRFAAATVRGTQWTTSDRCDGTLVSVQLHTVAVTDFVRHITVLVHQGHSYLARAPGARHA